MRDNGGLATLLGLYCQPNFTGVTLDCPCIDTARIRGTYWPVSSQRRQREDGREKTPLCCNELIATDILL